MVSIEELPKVTIPEQSSAPRATEIGYVCSASGADGKQASAYCTDCGKLMCREHEEVKYLSDFQLRLLSRIVFHTYCPYSSQLQYQTCSPPSYYN